MRRLVNASTTVQQRSLLLGFCIALAASPALAQVETRDSAAAPQPGSVLHVVKPQDTLHEIARRYLGRASRWPELFKANSSQIRNPNLIYPGQKLYVGADGKPTFTPPSVGAVSAATPAIPPEPEVMDQSRTVQLGRQTGALSASPLENATITGRSLRPSVRRGEAAAAPFLVAMTAKSDAGSLVARADPTIIAAASSRDQFLIFDEVDVLLPVGMRGTVGQRLGVYQMGPEVRYAKLHALLAQPSGVIELVAIGTGRAARAKVTSMFANMKRGDLVLPLEAAQTETVRPTDMANGPVYEVAHVAGGVVLPTVQNYIVIALPQGASSKVGDLYSLFAPGAVLTETGRDVAPPNAVALVSVVRVTLQGATAIVVGHDQPAIRVGMKAQLVSRMP
jgi:LysM repeat protein